MATLGSHDLTNGLTYSSTLDIRAGQASGPTLPLPSGDWLWGAADRGLQGTVTVCDQTGHRHTSAGIIECI